jgi:PAS domain S-box-containing protein
MIEISSKTATGHVTDDRHMAVKSEQLRAYFSEANDQNLAGALVLSLIVFVVHDGIPQWTWLPALLALYAVTIFRIGFIRQYHHAPNCRSATQWGHIQTITGALSGVCWGAAGTAMLAHVSVEYQLFILTVMTVSAATNSSEGYAYAPPSQVFILLALSPVILWLLAFGDRIHHVLAAMLTVFVPLTLMQGRKRNDAFIEAQHYRFGNEALARELATRSDAAEQEIRERKQAETALAESEARFKLFMDVLPAAVVIKDEASTTLYCNRYMADIMGARDWMGKSVIDLFPREVAEKMLADDRRALEAGYLVFEERVSGADGQVRLYETHKFILPRSGMPPLLGLIALDITERKQAQAEMIAAKESAEAANLAKSRFLAAASHDLRQPIQAIKLFEAALDQTGLSTAQKQVHGYLSQSVQSLGVILDALLDVSKLDAGMVPVSPEPIPIEDLLHAIDAEFSPVATAKSLRFKLHFPQESLSLFTDAKLLHVLLGNLIGNAFKYTERGGVLVGFRRRGARALIQVWDTGLGIAPEDMANIFDEYFQIGNPERDRTKGLGLGLAIAKRIASLLGAEIACHSRLNEGSVFEFSLPLADRAPAKDATMAETKDMLADAASSLVGRHIIVIDDHALVAEATRLTLESYGLRVTTHGNAEEALANPGITNADFYISDLSLPGMNGVRLLDAIQRRSMRPINAVVLTGNTAPDQIEMVQSSGWKVLYKPINLPALLSAISGRT